MSRDMDRTKKFKEMLEAAKSRLLNSTIMANREDLHTSSDDLADEADLASSVMTQSVSTTIRDHEVEELKNIEEAMHRLDEGSYFECEDCGDEIEDKRLKAMPTTKLCISCAETVEHNRKIYA